MPRLIFGHTDLLADWCARKIPHVGLDGFGPCQAIGVASDTTADFWAVIVFHDWQESARTLQLSMAATSPHWATRGVLRGLLHYAFQQQMANKLWTATPADNERAIKFNMGIGFRREAVLREQFGPKRHGVICSMLAREYARSRWCVRVPETMAA